MHPDYIFKTFLIGKKSVGRSTFAKSPYFSGFMDSDLTTGICYWHYDYSFDSGNKDKCVKLQIWSYNPEIRFKLLFSSYITGSHAIFIMFDVSDLTSLNEIDSWMEVIRERYKPEDNVPIMLLGNKADLTEHLESAKVLADSLVKKHGLMGYYEISVLDSTNLELTLRTMAETLVQKLKPNWKRDSKA